MISNLSRESLVFLLKHIMKEFPIIHEGIYKMLIEIKSTKKENK